MFATIRRIGCLSVIGFVIFVVLALWKGGDALRWMGDWAGGEVQKTTTRLAEKADEIKQKADEAKERIRKWSNRGWKEE